MSNDSPRGVLVVDDDVDTCHNLSDILTDFDYEVMTANNGFDALELVRRHAFDVALLDLQMPGMDGLTLFREIKKLGSGTVGIIITAYATGDSVEQVLQAGAWHVLSKPVDLGRLMPLVGEASQQPLVMIVDDDPDLLQALRSILETSLAAARDPPRITVSWNDADLEERSALHIAIRHSACAMCAPAS